MKTILVSFLVFVSVGIVACASDTPSPSQQPVLLDCPPASSKSTPLDRMVRVPPEYPRKAFEKNLEGYVRLEFDISSEGKPLDLRVTQERPEGYGFGESAARAVRQWRYCPYDPEDPSALTHAEIAIPFKLRPAPGRKPSP